MFLLAASRVCVAVCARHASRGRLLCSDVSKREPGRGHVLSRAPHTGGEEGVGSHKRART